jgi:S1-C subfamily serine protease
MKAGDVIISIDGKPIQDSVAAMAAIAALKPGQKSNFGVIRNQKEIALTIEIGKRPKQQRTR